MNWIERYMQLFVGRSSDHSVQLATGNYARAGKPLNRARVTEHLRGEVSLATYLLDESNHCRFAVFDADDESGLLSLADVQKCLDGYGLPAHLEQSRRGAHLWLFLDSPMPAREVRARLLPLCPSGIEFYPKQDVSNGVGSAIRLPFGVHRRSGRRYPFVERASNGQWHAIGPCASEQVEALYAHPRASLACLPVAHQPSALPEKKLLSLHTHTHTHTPHTYRSIRDWNASHDYHAVDLLSRYVDLDSCNSGQCPFGWHHANGHDDHSLRVYRPAQSGGYCWYCYAWQRGGSLFDFLRYWHGLEARELWRRIQTGEEIW